MVDMRSVFLVQILVLFVCFAILLQTWLQNRHRYHGLGCWVLMMGLTCVGYVLLALRNIAPDVISIIVANLLIVCAFVLFDCGLVFFYGLKNNAIPSVVLIITVLILQIFFTYYYIDIQARIIVISIAFILIYGHAMWLLIFQITPKQRAVSKALIWSIVGIILLNVYRVVVHVFFLKDQSGLFDQSFLENLFIILQVPAILLLVFNMVVLVMNFLMLEVKNEETKFNIIFHSAPFAAIITNYENSKVVELNDEMLKLVEYDAEEIIGKTLLDLGMWVDHEERQTLIRDLLIDGTVNGREYKFRSKSGKISPVLFSASLLKLNGKDYIVATMKDISEIYRLRYELEELASHDMLTGLPNRRKFDEISTILLARASRSGEKLALVMFDIDEFKCVNDDYGHDVGDKVLVAVADRLREFSRSADNVARHGGDEFTILLSGMKDSSEVKVALKRLYKLYEEPIVVEGHAFKIRICCGISLFPDHGINTEELLKKADKALYDAKRKGKNMIKFASQTDEA